MALLQNMAKKTEPICTPKSSMGLICLIYSAYIDLKSSLFDVNDLVDPVDLCEEAVVQRL